MLMWLCSLRHFAKTSSDPIWERRYRAALQYELRDPVDIAELDQIVGVPAVLPSVWKVEGSERPGEADTETWRARKPLL